MKSGGKYETHAAAGRENQLSQDQEQGSSKAKQTPAEFQHNRNKIQYELNAEIIDKIGEAMEADEPEEPNRVLREGPYLEEKAYSNIGTSVC